MSKFADFCNRFARLKCRCPLGISQRDLHGSFRFVYAIFILQLSLIVPLSVAVALNEQTFQALLEGFHMVLSLSSIVAMILLHVALKYEHRDFKRDGLQTNKTDTVPDASVHLEHKSTSETKEPETGQLRRTNLSDHHLPASSSTDPPTRPSSFNPPVIIENDLSTIREESPSPSPASPPASPPFIDEHSSPMSALLSNSGVDRAAHGDHEHPHGAHDDSLHVPGQFDPERTQRISTASNASQAVGLRRLSGHGSRLSLAAQSAVTRTRKITMQMIEFSQQAIRSVVPDANGDVAVLKPHNRLQVRLSGADLCMRIGALGFGIGGMFMVALRLADAVTDPEFYSRCRSFLFPPTQVAYLVFILAQNCFLFLYQSRKFPRRNQLVRFLLLHLICANLGIWVNAVVFEVTEDIHEKTVTHAEYTHIQPMQNLTWKTHAPAAEILSFGTPPPLPLAVSSLTTLSALSSSTGSPSSSWSTPQPTSLGQLLTTTMSAAVGTVSAVFASSTPLAQRNQTEPPTESTYFLCHGRKSMSLFVAPVLFPMLVEFTMIAGAILVKMYLHSYSKQKHGEHEEHSESEAVQTSPARPHASSDPSAPPSAHLYEKHGEHHENRSSALNDAAQHTDGAAVSININGDHSPPSSSASPQAEAEAEAAAGSPQRKCYPQINDPPSPPLAENSENEQAEVRPHGRPPPRSVSMMSSASGVSGVEVPEKESVGGGWAGLLAGLVLLFLTVLAITLFFYFSIKAEQVEEELEKEKEMLSSESVEQRIKFNRTLQKQKKLMHRTTRSATLIYQTCELVILSAGTIGIFLCIYYLRSFSKQKMHRGERIDSYLLLCGFAGTLMFNTFYMLASIELLKGYSVWMLIGWVAKTLLALTQSTSQTMYVLRGFKAFIPSLEEFCEEHVASGPSGNALEMQQQSPHIQASGSVSRHIHQQQQDKQQQRAMLHETPSNSTLAPRRQMTQAEATKLHRRLLHSHKALSFVCLCNLALWLANSFQTKYIDLLPQLYLVGARQNSHFLPWSIVTHLLLPFIIFFRFHSLICLVHIWFQLFSKRSRRLALEHARRAAASHPAGTRVVDHAQT